MNCRSLLIFPLFALLGLQMPGCITRARDPWEGTPPGQTKILASFPPLYCFTANVAGDKARVICLLTGNGPHSYQATPADASRAAGADVVFVNGLELDERAVGRLMGIARADKSKLVNLGERLDKKSLIRLSEKERDHGDHQHGEFDPHFWLGPKEARAMVGLIADELDKRDPANQSTYDKNAADYIAKIDALEQYGRDQFKGKKSTAFITQHESLGYFARTFGLDLVKSIQAQPGVEADAAQLGELVEACKANNVGVIAVEPQYSRGQAESLARALRQRGIDVTIVEVDPMETAQPEANGNPSPDLYLTRMKANIDALAKAFK